MSFLKRFFLSLRLKQKLAEENLPLEKYLQRADFKPEIVTEPFRYIVIDNFFKQEFVEDLSSYFNSLLSKGLSPDPDERSMFHVFKEAYPYDGYVYAPSPTTQEPLKLFFSVAWNQYFSKLFNKPTTFGTHLTFHHHPKGDRTGWVHSDYSTHLFPQKKILPNGVHVLQMNAEQTLSQKEMNFEPFRQKRTIALLYYFNSPTWEEGDGGETGIYALKTDSVPIIKIAPLQNRLFAFDISPTSFHAFQENVKDRNCFVQWFHIDEEWAEKKYGTVYLN